MKTILLRWTNRTFKEDIAVIFYYTYNIYINLTIFVKKVNIIEMNDFHFL